ncbi:hypothetical protein LSAT2_013432 [Lamellibrachia satsuma]|nr:hypothetical protein LSAT2_013432 [Lamellibrachia satsuma]
MVTSMRTVLLLTSMLLAVFPRAQGGTFKPCLSACEKERSDCQERCDAIGLCNQYIEPCKLHCDGLAANCRRACIKHLPSLLLQ